jgi:GWxTD domain-containing protein
MRAIILLSLCLLLSIASEANVSAYFSYSTFDLPGKVPYVETYIDVAGRSVKALKNDKGFYQGRIEVQMIFRNGEQIVHFDKYNLLSPESTDPAAIPHFIDQQRVSLPEGSYDLELKISDKNSGEKEFILNQKINLQFPKDTISISDIELLESYEKSEVIDKFHKSGYRLIPYVNAFYPKEISAIKFYAEVYRSGIVPAEDYLLRYYITNKNNRQLVEELVGSVKHSPSEVNVLLAELPIADLPSGNYFLNIELRDRKNSLIGFRQTFFQRSNQLMKNTPASEISSIDISNTFISEITNKDTLIEQIAAMYPLASSLENDIAETQMRIADVRSMQQYIYYFWSRRYPENPEEAWRNYQMEVRKVNNSYSTIIKKGYDTDRGRVYLQYGPPNQISLNENDPDVAFPYEIWHYYKIDDQSNRKFVFYLRSRSTNDFHLLHSDANGELQEPNWQTKLNSGQMGNDVQAEPELENSRTRRDDYFSNPR